jgi:hypothetical protein
MTRMFTGQTMKISISNELGVSMFSMFRGQDSFNSYHTLNLPGPKSTVYFFSPLRLLYFQIFLLFINKLTFCALNFNHKLLKKPGKTPKKQTNTTKTAKHPF